MVLLMEILLAFPLELTLKKLFKNCKKVKGSVLFVWKPLRMLYYLLAHIVYAESVYYLVGGVQQQVFALSVGI